MFAKRPISIGPIHIFRKCDGEAWASVWNEGIEKDKEEGWEITIRGIALGKRGPALFIVNQKRR